MQSAKDRFGSFTSFAIPAYPVRLKSGHSPSPRLWVHALEGMDSLTRNHSLIEGARGRAHRQGERAFRRSVAAGARRVTILNT
jgi:hypothetical protein